MRAGMGLEVLRLGSAQHGEANGGGQGGEQRNHAEMVVIASGGDPRAQGERRLKQGH